jgi:hypothetical protein
MVLPKPTEGVVRSVSANPNQFNQIRPADGGPFPLPSKIFPLPGAMWSELHPSKAGRITPDRAYRASIRTRTEAQAVAVKKMSQRAGDGARAIETPHVLRQSAIRGQVAMSKMCNQTNHMRPADGGAFILPSNFRRDRTPESSDVWRKWH